MSEQPNGRKIEFEPTDADLAAVTKVGAGIAVLATVVALALVPILHGMVARQKKTDASAPPIAGFEAGRKAPEPRLQGEPFGDWTALKAQQDALLGSYGWVDEPAGVTRIPIDEAMKLLLARGLPVSAPAAPAPAAPAPAASPAPAAPAAPATGSHP